MKAVGIIILSADASSILLLKRSALEENEQGKWENTGGKLRAGETFEQALYRELQEELGVKAVSYELVLEYGGATTENNIRIYKARIAGVPRRMEPDLCDEIKWLPLKGLKTVDLADYSRQDFVHLSWL